MEITLNSYPKEVAALQHLADKHHLRLTLPDGDMIGKDFVIRVSVDREGVRIWYYDAQSLPDITMYALDFLLYRKRLPEKQKPTTSTNNAERVGLELKESIEQMGKYIPDVLNGSRTWFKEYEWDVIPLLGTKRDQLAKYLEK